MGPHQLMMFCMKMAGMVHITGGPLLTAFSYYMFCCFFIFGSALTIHLLQEDRPLMAQLQSYHYIIAMTQIFCKFLSIFLNQTEAVDILYTIESLAADATTDKKNTKIIERADRLGTRIAKVFLFMFCAYYPLRVTSLLVKHYLLGAPPQAFLPAAWVPPALADRYVLSVLFQVFTTLCVGFTNASYSIFIFFVTLQISAQIQVLRRMLEETCPLGPCILLHQKLMRLFIRVNRLLSGLMFVEIVLTSFYSCVCSFLIIQSLSTGGKDMANHVHVLLLVLVRSFIICYCGNIIATQGERLHGSVYFGGWYELNRKDRQSLHIMLALTTAQPFQYNYRQFITIDMAQFVKSMQTTYSYLTMLLSFADF